MGRTPQAETVVVGAGNPLLADEGIGVCVVRELAKRPDLPRGVDVVEAGASPLALVHILSNRRRAVLVDCARMGRAPGELCRFSPEGVSSLKRLPGLSLHEGDLLTSLEIARRIGECPEDVVILGIEPEDTSFGSQVSRRLHGKIEDYVQAVLGEI
ncbi:MAG: hydrogenase maturation protease [Thermodesulfobacteriota bacterium]